MPVKNLNKYTCQKCRVKFAGNFIYVDGVKTLVDSSKCFPCAV